MKKNDFKIGDRVYIRAREYLHDLFLDRRKVTCIGKVVFIGKIFIYVEVKYTTSIMPYGGRENTIREYRKFSWQITKVEEDQYEKEI